MSEDKDINPFSQKGSHGLDPSPPSEGTESTSTQVGVRIMNPSIAEQPEEWGGKRISLLPGALEGGFLQHLSSLSAQGAPLPGFSCPPAGLPGVFELLQC